DVQAGGDDEVGHRGANGSDNVACQAGAILETTAEGARSCPGRQQLTEQVAVALLDVNEIEADAPGEAGGRDVGVDEPAQGIVVEQRIGRVDARERIEEGVVKG